MKKLTFISLIATLIGLTDSVYLSWLKFSHNESLCVGGIGDCYTVNTSPYAEVYGIPIAVLGFGAYLLILLVLLLRERVDFLRENGSLIVFGLSLIGVIYSAYLSYLEEFVIHAWCPYCVLSAVMITTVFVTSIIRLKKENEEV
jgi:uncharacterized membrane protein